MENLPIVLWFSVPEDFVSFFERFGEKIELLESFDIQFNGLNIRAAIIKERVVD